MIDDTFAETLADLAAQRQRSKRRTELQNDALQEMMMTLGPAQNAMSAGGIPGSGPGTSGKGGGPTNYGNTSLRAAEGSSGFQAFVRSIAQQESGGNYGARNASSGAMGKYQIMPANIAGSGGWDKQALGYNISPQQFMRNKKLQDAVALFKLREYYNKYGASGAAQAWYGGPGSVGRNVSGGAGYPSSNAYARSIRRRMKGR